MSKMTLSPDIVSLVARFVASEDLGAFAATVLPRHKNAIQKNISALTNEINRLGSERVALVSFLTNLIADPDTDEHPPFEDEALRKLESYAMLLRNSCIVGGRRHRMTSQLIELTTDRLHLGIPQMEITNPLDILVCLHFSKIEDILELGDYFEKTEKWLGLVARRDTLVAALVTSSRSGKIKIETSVQQTASLAKTLRF